MWEDWAHRKAVQPEAAGKLDTPCTGSRVQEGRESITHGNVTKNLTVSIVTPTGGFRVDGAVNSTPISFLVDTGSAVTLIRKDTWDQMQSSAKTQTLQRWSEFSLVGANGTPLDVCGHTIADLSIKGHTYQADVVVVSPLTTEAILEVRLHA